MAGQRIFSGRGTRIYSGEEMIVLLSGGTGTPKLLQGLIESIPPDEISVVVNTGEDFWLPHGYFSPDIDTVLYTLSGVIDDDAWHGIKGDSYTTHSRLLELGHDEVLKIGDKDRAIHIYRGRLMRQGLKLSEVTERLRMTLRIKSRVYPMSDDPVKTVIITPDKDMSLHEFWVENKGSPQVTGINLRGIKEARPCSGALKAIKSAEGIVIGPSNPVSSILPIISIPELRKALVSKKNRVAISPIVGNRPVSGPADKFMRALGMHPSARGVAELYKGLIDFYVIDAADKKFEIEGLKVLKTGIIMDSLEKKKALARYILGILNIS
jgi:LPPG:FO 2-phospho-L-lactate transferase